MIKEDGGDVRVQGKQKKEEENNDQIRMEGDCQ